MRSEGQAYGSPVPPVFQKLVRELEQAGLAKSETELFLEYLRRVGQPWRKEILQYKMMGVAPDGSPTIRAPVTWKESHRVLVELAANSDGSKALVGAVHPKKEKPGPTGGGGAWSEGAIGMLVAATGLDRDAIRQLLEKFPETFEKGVPSGG